MTYSATLRTTPVIDPGDFATNYAELMLTTDPTDVTIKCVINHSVDDPDGVITVESMYATMLDELDDDGDFHGAEDWASRGRMLIKNHLTVPFGMPETDEAAKASILLIQRTLEVVMMMVRTGRLGFKV
jgi:hypothetical protein